MFRRSIRVSIRSRTIKVKTICRCPKPPDTSFSVVCREFGARSLDAAPPPVIYIRKLIIRSHPHLPSLSPVVQKIDSPGWVLPRIFFFLLKSCLVVGAKFLIGESWHSRINGDLIKDYSSSKIKINRVSPLPSSADRKEENVSGWRAWRRRTFRLAIPLGQQP